MHVNFNSFCLDLGGGNRFVLELANCLIDKGHKVTITHLGNKDTYAWFPGLKAEVINLDGLSLSLPFKGYKKAFSKFSKAYGSGNLSAAEMCLVDGMPDCDVNVATYCFTAYPTYYSGIGRGFYLVQHFEPWFFSDPKVKSRAESTYTLPLRRLCVSKWLTDKVEGTLIGNGINLSKFRNLLIPKNYDVMVVNRGIDWKGNYAPIVEALQKKGFKVFVADGKLSEEELVWAYNSSRIFLFLSKHEGFGYPPLEAMACGVPVITTPCLEYALQLNNALVLQENFTAEQVVNAVQALLGDKGLYDKVSVNGRLTAKLLNFKYVVNRFEDAINLNKPILAQSVNCVH